ncbi:hypothetical protein HCG49_02335 [Arenibacter sp. 6A1]|uniref:hypothetical protein n=1 Tax=Arenibacter sp. 6A1 TaxID=2720391 RepID=UPI001444FFFF|nr:hypothetical protein [Arenibacter sp. 6A1]NKI25395.1 hypothetical protein [Arenibacter sp. 6A1]
MDNKENSPIEKNEKFGLEAKLKSEENQLKAQENNLKGQENQLKFQKAELVSKSLDKTADAANNILKYSLESKKLASDTAIQFEKIKQNHYTINKNIDNEYEKQNRVIDTAEEVVQKGLEDNDFGLIKLGLEQMSGVANHNPMADLKNHLDNQIEKDFEDDDFIIEI